MQSGESYQQDILRAARDSVPVALGYIPLGIGMGMLLTGAGIDWWWAPVFAIFMYSGSLQYLLVPMIAAHEPLIAIALATLLIQLRHIFYGISFPLDLVPAKLGKLYAIHALTDEAYALIAAKPRAELTGRRILLTQLFCQLTWIFGCAAGALLGLAVPIDPRILNFAMTALFLVLMIEAYQNNPARKELLFTAGIAAGALLIPANLFLPVALSALTLLLMLTAHFASKPASPESAS
ncbi:MAG: AzlC family ABC transporter permease [Trueperella sp.]|nr:AzlC family ABC transporter permease [Trueperella sp.]